MCALSGTGGSQVKLSCGGYASNPRGTGACQAACAWCAAAAGQPHFGRRGAARRTPLRSCGRARGQIVRDWVYPKPVAHDQGLLSLAWLLAASAGDAACRGTTLQQTAGSSSRVGSSLVGRKSVQRLPNGCPSCQRCSSHGLPRCLRCAGSAWAPPPCCTTGHSSRPGTSWRASL